MEKDGIYYQTAEERKNKPSPRGHGKGQGRGHGRNKGRQNHHKRSDNGMDVCANDGDQENTETNGDNVDIDNNGEEDIEVSSETNSTEALKT